MPQNKKSSKNMFVSFDGTPIYYEISGDPKNKNILLFLHGLGGNLTAWNPQRDYFTRKGYTTITIDLRGHGFSGRPINNEKYTMEMIAKDIYYFLKALDNPNIVIVGQCLGGIVALVLVGLYHIQPKKLILIATSYKFPSYISLMQRAKILSLCSYVISQLPTPLGKAGHMPVDKYRGTSDLNVMRVSSDIFYTTPQSYLAICSNLFIYNAEKLLKNILCPTLIIHGTADSIFSQKMARQLCARITNAELLFVPKANHILVLNNPKELNYIIESYLDKPETYKPATAQIL